MTKYIIEMMTEENYKHYKNGGYAPVKQIEVNAENKNIAKEIVKANEKYNGMIITNVTDEKEEMQARAKLQECFDKIRERENNAKQKRLDNEIKKAAELGLTLEEYRKQVAKNTTIKKYKTQIEKAREEIARLQKEIDRKMKYIEENEV